MGKQERWAVLYVVGGRYIKTSSGDDFIWYKKETVDYWLDLNERKYPGLKLRYIAVNLDKEQVEI